MKVAILTLSPGINYGNLLQAYALQTILESLGHEATILGKNRIQPEPPCHVYLKRIIQKKLLNKNVHVFRERDSNQYYLQSVKNTILFVKKYLHIREIKSLQQLQPTDYDAIIVGSDQVWRHSYFTVGWQTSIADAYLAFSKGWSIKRVAYAASFGTQEWEYSIDETKLCSVHLQSFNGVSVREDIGVELCQKYLNVQAQHVLDPTMLLEKEDYIRLIQQANVPVSSGDLLYYVLDETEAKRSIAELIESKGKFTLFRVNEPFSKKIVQPSVEQWLRGFYDAKFIITDSFHACVFSILFNKPFIVIGNEKRGLSRFKSLLKMIGQEYRLVTEESYFEMRECVLSCPNVDLTCLRQYSVDFLKSSIVN